jgi:hypothetical protein
MSYFYGTYPSGKRVGRLFDLARLVLQPDYARKAHITLRGPYEKKPSPRSKWLRYQPSSAFLGRPGTFFNEWQSTVYLRISFLEEHDLSWKPDFKDSVPHMSVYDGRDRSFAWQVLQVLREFSWDISVELTPVLILEKKKEYESSFFLELDDIDLAFGYISERPMTRDYLKSMHVGQRLFLLRRICEAILATQTATH